MRRGLARTLTNLGEAATLAVIACYVTGFVVVNSYYLITYGYAGSGIFKVKYISAGILFLVILLLLVAAIYPIYWASSQPEDNSVKTPKRRRQASIAGPSLCIVLLWQLLVRITSPDIKIESEGSWLTYLPSAFMAAWFGLIGAEQALSWKVPEKSWIRITLTCVYVVLGLGVFFSAFMPLNILFLLTLLGALSQLKDPILSKQPLLEQFREWPVAPTYNLLYSGLLFLTALVVFGAQFYGHVYPHFGGGAPPHVRIVLTADGKKAVEKLGYESPPSGTFEHVHLIDSDEQDYLVVLRWSDNTHGGLVQLKRAHVDSLLYLPTSSK